METDNMDTMELIAAVEHNAYQELMRMPYSDPARSKILDEAEMCFKVRNGYEQSEQNRLNNYTKNEIEDRKIDVEMKKAKNDKARTISDNARACLFILAGLFSGFAGYAMDTWYQKDRRLSDFQRKCQDLSIRK